MTYICKNCYEEFNTPNKTSSRMGLAWIIFIFFSMGIGLIFWLFMRGKAKEICPHCKSENFIRTDSRAGIVLVNQFREAEKAKDIENIQEENTIESIKVNEDELAKNDSRNGMIAIVVFVLFCIAIIGNIN